MTFAELETRKLEAKTFESFGTPTPTTPPCDLFFIERGLAFFLARRFKNWAGGGDAPGKGDFCEMQVD
jgi:hypothetical protein